MRTLFYFLRIESVNLVTGGIVYFYMKPDRVRVSVELSNGTKQQKYTILHRTRMSWLINKYYLGVLCLEMTENGDDHVFTPTNHDFVLSDGRIVRPTDTPEALGLREGDVIRVQLDPTRGEAVAEHAAWA